MAHAALPALLPTPPNYKMLPLLPPPPPFVVAILPKPLAAKPGRADSDERWDAHKTSASSSSHLSTSADSIRNSAGRRSSRQSVTSPPRMPGWADSVERWDAHKKAAASAASSSGTSSVVSSKCSISRASSAERWDVHKKRCPLRTDDGDSSSTGSNDIDMEDEEEEIVWKPRVMYAGPGFAAAVPKPRMLPMPTSFLVLVA